MIMPIIIATIIDDVFYNKNISSLNNLIIVYLILFLGAQFFRLMGLIAWQFISNTLIFNLKRKIFSLLIKTKASFLVNKSTGDIMQYFTDAEEVLNIIDINIVAFINSVIQLVLTIAFICFIDIRYILLFLLTVPWSLLVTKINGKKTNHIYEQRREKSGQYSGWLYEILDGLREIRLLGASGVIKNLFNHKNAELIRLQNEASKISVISGVTFGLITLLSDLSLYILSAFLIMKNEITIGFFVAVLQYFSQSTTQFNSVLNAFIDFKRRQTNLKKVMNVFDLDTEEEIESSLNIQSGSIKFDNVHFGYTEEISVLKDLSLTINSGKTVSFVGKSGVGKSTISNLLIHFFEPTKGDIYIDGQNLSQYSLSTLRKEIGIVYQDFTIFCKSVKENLLLLNPEASDEKIIDICKKTDIYNMIQKMPNGINTALGVNGFDISGGQKQRLAIARILMKNPKILILDEATSSLDNQTEQTIMKSLNSFKEGRTIIIIAHKLSNVMDSDKIFLMDNGKIVDTGTHKELMENSIIYKKMFNNEISERDKVDYEAI
jgi:ABC-type bacteriocin/lantibiotic exporter with double-glycine peptidase domain